ncbi:hypothetical protein ABZ806_19735 [Spirillospora sp. NPDC047418]
MLEPVRTEIPLLVEPPLMQSRPQMAHYLVDQPADLHTMESNTAVSRGPPAKQNQFPCKVIRIGICYRVPTAALLAVLDIE